MTKVDPVAWLYSFDRIGWKFGLERTNELLDCLGNPHQQLQIIHVAGTNGKGSVCLFISSILQKAGYNVGVYLSPHLQRFSERIAVNNDEISEHDLTMLVEKIRPLVDGMIKKENTPTFFEITTAIAFEYFKEKKIDYAVIEVGLGGRFDATNVVMPLVSVITNISLEHTDILGKDIRSIATEKAGIIKDHAPVITAATNDALNTITTIAQEKNAPLRTIEKNSWKRTSHDLHTQHFTIQGSLKDYRVKTSLLGQHQGENIALALATIEQLQMNGVYVSDNDIVEGITTATNPGRMEIISEHPLILLDGAHNPGGMRMLVKTLKEDFTYDNLILVLGILKDKDLEEMLRIILPSADHIILTQSTSPRACDPFLLETIIKKQDPHKHAIVEPSLPKALEQARALLKPKDLLCVSGSLFTVGEARTYLLHQES